MLNHQQIDQATPPRVRAVETPAVRARRHNGWTGKLRDQAKRVSFGLFALGDRAGVHVLPSHYYSSLPNWSWLREHEDSWRRPAPLHGIHWDLREQADWLRENVGRQRCELSLERLMADSSAVGGFRYGPIEAQALYGILRARQPRRIVEIGSGSSTLVMSQAVQRNVAEGGSASEILAIDPFAAELVRGLPYVEAAGTHGIDLTIDDLALQPGDLLFVDSTHAVRTGSEVPHIYLNLIPALPPGVLIHIHDISLPYLYPPGLYEMYFDWQETVLLAGLLVNNRSLQVRAGMAGLAYDCPEVLHELFPDYQPAPVDRGLLSRSQAGGHLPSSLWLETAQ